MLIFYVGIAILIVVSLIELNPKGFKKGMPHLKTDKNSGAFLTLSSIAVGLGSLLDWFFDLLTFKTNNREFFILFGMGLLLIGFVIRSLAIKKLGGDFNYAVAPIKKLQTKGIYRMIRHPSYLGTLLYAISIPLLFSSGLGLTLAVLVISSIIYRIKIEEDFLEKTIGFKYIKYEKNTYRIIPYIH